MSSLELRKEFNKRRDEKHSLVERIFDLCFNELCLRINRIFLTTAVFCGVNQSFLTWMVFKISSARAAEPTTVMKQSLWSSMWYIAQAWYLGTV